MKDYLELKNFLKLKNEINGLFWKFFMLNLLMRLVIFKIIWN